MTVCRFCRWFAGLFVAAFACSTCAAATYVLTINTNGSGIVNRNPTNVVVPEGAVVTLTAIPATNWTFTFWSGDASGSTNPLNVMMDRDKSITANFSPQQPPGSYTLTVSVSGQGNVNPSSGTYTQNTVVTLTATPSNGWVFGSWTGSATGSVNPLSVTMDTNKAITAIFGQPPIITAQPENFSATAAGTATFKVSANGTAPLSYVWQFNGAIVPGATTSNLTIMNVQQANAGSYRVIVTNSFGAITSQVAALTVDCPASNPVAVCQDAELRQAVARGGLVRFCCQGTIYLTNAIDITNNVQLDGSTRNVVISGSNVIQLFRVARNVTFALTNLTLSKPASTSGFGGAISNNGGTVQLVSCMLSNNSASSGGAIYNEGGTILLDRVLATQNSATSGSGGAIRSQNGLVLIDNCTFVDNYALGHISIDGAGGALRSDDRLVVIKRSSFVGNYVRGIFGALVPRPIVATSGTGGALYVSSATTTVFRCQFTGNQAFGGGGQAPAYAWGGAVFVAGGVFEARDSTFSANEAYGGSNVLFESRPGNGGALAGSGVIRLNNSTFDRNIAGEAGKGGNGGAIYNGGTLFATNCTLTWNSAIGEGGGIYNTGTMLSMMNVTVASNTAVPTNSVAAGANIANAGGGTLTFRNSLVAYGGPSPSSNASGVITDGGFNISSDGSCNFNSGSSFNFTDPRLSPLANNGGPTLTMRPQPNSPAIDFGTASGAPPFDQRGAQRPAGSGVDMGAFEIGPIAPFLSLQRDDSMLSLSFTAEAGASYQLQYSTNLLAWQLQEVIGSAPSNRWLLRSIPVAGARRFFRLH